jgi:preprotein translocase subunit SecA
VVPQLKKQIGEADPRTGEGVIEPGDFTVDEKSHQVFLTEDGHENAERCWPRPACWPRVPACTTRPTSR